MFRIIPMLFLLLLFSSFALNLPERVDSTAAARISAPKPDGEKIFKIYCIACHGLDGNLGASGAAKLTESTLPLAERIKVVTNGRNAMTGFKALLKPDQINAVAKYTMELKKK